MDENENMADNRRKPRLLTALTTLLAVRVGGWGTLWAIAWLAKSFLWD
jgi:hypothetical protein